MNIAKITTLIILITSVAFVGCKKDDDEKDTTTPTIKKSRVEMSELLAANSSLNVIVNPSGIAPLTAEITFETSSSATVEVKVDGKIPVSKKFDVSTTSHEVPILGLYPGVSNNVILTVTNKNSYSIDTLQIIPDSISPYLPDVIINSKNTALMEPGMNLNTVSISDGSYFQPYPMIYDHEGDLRWYLNLEGIHPGFVAPMKRLENGYILFETGSSVVEYDMMGNKKVDVPIPSGYTSHHDVIKIPNGNYVLPVDKHSATITVNGVTSGTVEDHMIEIDGTTGALVEEWDFRAMLDIDRDALELFDPNTSGSRIDWFHQNAVNYSENDDCFIVSGRNQGLIKVGRNNELKWIMGTHLGWEKAGHDGSGDSTSPYLLTAVNASGNPYDSVVQYGYQRHSGFDWPWGQHAPVYLPNGNILLFDNGINRQYGQGSDYARAVEYKVDENNMTVEQVWAYGQSRGSDTFSSIISDVDLLPETGNILFAPGIMFGINTSKIVEVTYPGNSVAFEGTLSFKNTRTTGSGFGEFDLCYRAERLTLYPKIMNY